MDGELPVGTIERMVELVDPAWTVREAARAERGFCRVYRLVVETPERPRECYLKAAPEDADAGVAADARILAVLGEHTRIPVPDVLGTVDGHPDLPAPFYLMTPMPGSERPYEAVGRLPDDTVRTLADETGRYLGEAHLVDAVGSFGHVDRDPARPLDGDRPAGTVPDLAVRDGCESWPTFLRTYVERELDRHAGSRFGHLTPRLRDWCGERIEALSGPFSPVLGRNDHGLHNLLVDPDTGEVTAMLDWAYTLAVPPAFDLGFATYLYGGAFLAGLPDVRDRRHLVHEALSAGYRETAPGLADAVRDRNPFYEVLAAVRVMNDFERLAPRLPDGTEGAVADRIGADVGAMLGDE